jgi:Amt family ammonium transporter
MKKSLPFLLLVIVVILALMYPGTTVAPAPATSPIDKADTAWLLISTALVLLMTPGLAFFYGGMVQQKKRHFNHAAKLCLYGFDYHYMGCIWF